MLVIKYHYENYFIRKVDIKALDFIHLVFEIYLTQIPRFIKIPDFSFSFRVLAHKNLHENVAIPANRDNQNN